MDSTRMAKKEENGESFLEASPGLCLDLPRRNVYGDVVCVSSKGGVVES